MDLYRIIRELVLERDRVDQIIQSLEEHSGIGKGTRRGTSERRGRKAMDRAAREQVSERMKQYWQKRRAERDGNRAGSA
jgi:cobalamin biosynthesis protein CbiD